MRADRLRHARVLATRQRVVAAHHALQLRELADHAARQIGLGKLGRPRRQPRIGADLRGDQRGQLFQPCHTLPLGAELGVEDHAFQLRQEFLQALPPILVPEEPRIRKPRPQHPFIARDDRRAAIGGDNVAHQREARSRMPIRRAHRKIALVHPHGGAHHLGRQVHEGGID